MLSLLEFCFILCYFYSFVKKLRFFYSALTLCSLIYCFVFCLLSHLYLIFLSILFCYFLCFAVYYVFFFSLCFFLVSFRSFVLTSLVNRSLYFAVFIFVCQTFAFFSFVPYFSFLTLCSLYCCLLSVVVCSVFFGYSVVIHFFCCHYSFVSSLFVLYSLLLSVVAVSFVLLQLCYLTIWLSLLVS